MVLICAEVGSVFTIREGRCGSKIGDLEGGHNVCAKCRKSAYASFRNSTSGEILAFGIRPGDYG